MKSVYDRTEKLIGPDKLKIIKNSGVIVFGLGGVGGYAVEAFARAGVGRMGIVDFDVVDVTNINRQIIALGSTIGKYKTDVFVSRISDINKEIRVDAFKEKLSEGNVDCFFLGEYDYIVDAVDDVAAKVALIEKAKALNIPIISSMGTGNRMDPSMLKICDISRTHTCPLAKKVRKGLSIRGIEEVKTLFSDEPAGKFEGGPASISFVPAAAGLLIAGEVIRSLLSE